jgi:hypothetical protein
VLHQRLIPAPSGDLFSQRNLEWLAAQPLDPDGRAALDCNLRLLAHIEGELDIFNRELAAHAYQSETVKLLMTLPGVDVAVAETLLAALGDVSRFPTADQAAAYLGLAPSTYQSGEHCYHGRITKQGRGHARWMLVQAAQHLGNHPGPLGVFFRRVAQRKTRNVAVVAAARKLVTIAWHMLKNKEPYRYAQPHTTEAKFSRLRINAGGAKKRSGSPKGTARSANYGTGLGTRAIPALNQVYTGEQLPPCKDLKPGERKAIAQKGLTAWFEDISRPKRVPRSKAAG